MISLHCLDGKISPNAKAEIYEDDALEDEAIGYFKVIPRAEDETRGYVLARLISDAMNSNDFIIDAYVELYWKFTDICGDGKVRRRGNLLQQEFYFKKSDIV
uniref:Uncharacterized protein n=1 Tax=Panagrolaimus sp. JU765 TaxID=591449 RepID=A0AC34QTJ3_9BILA